MSLLTVKTLSLRVADEISNLAIEAATRNSFRPVAVCVMDPSGHPIVTKRMDGCPAIAYPKISFAKANTCVAMKCSSRAYGNKYLQGKGGQPVTPDVFARVLNQVSMVDGEIAAFQGGVLIRDADGGDIVGAVGVSGAAGDEDEYLAITAVKRCSLGGTLVIEPAEHSCSTVKDP